MGTEPTERERTAGALLLSVAKDALGVLEGIKTGNWGEPTAFVGPVRHELRGAIAYAEGKRTEPPGWWKDGDAPTETPEPVATACDEPSRGSLAAAALQKADDLLAVRGISAAEMAALADDAPPRIYAEALLAQSACNLVAILRTIPRLLDELKARGVPHEAQNAHPALRLFAEQISHLTRATDYGAAWDECVRNADPGTLKALGIGREEATP